MTKISHKKTFCLTNALLLLALLQNGCGEIAYKRGASAGDLDSSKKVCPAKSDDQPGYEKCMTAQGWQLENLDEAMAFDALMPVIASKPTQPASTANQQSSDTEKNDSNKAAVDSASKPETNPMARLSINSWWKLGGNAADLTKAKNECTKTLGEAHLVDAINQQVSVDFLTCMKEKGWRGLPSKP